MKFIISPGIINHPSLIEKFRDPATSWITYRYRDYIERAYFPESYVQINNSRDRLLTLNDLSYDPLKTTIIEQEIDFQLKPLFDNKIKLLLFSPNLIKYEVKNDQDALMVLSETPYSPGWKAKINDESVKIFNANHVNMAVIMPKGRNILEFKFYPNSYYNYRILEMLTAIFLYGILIYILYFKINNNRKLVIGE